MTASSLFRGERRRAQRLDTQPAHTGGCGEEAQARHSSQAMVKCGSGEGQGTRDRYPSKPHASTTHPSPGGRTQRTA
jgi:hypothetical protein